MGQRSLQNETPFQGRRPSINRTSLPAVVGRLQTRAGSVWNGDEHQALKLVQAGDRDWFMPTDLRGFLCKCCNRTTVKQWKLVQVELKGTTVFYFRVDPVDFSPTQSARRIDLALLEDCRIDKNGQQHGKDRLCFIYASGKSKDFRSCRNPDDLQKGYEVHDALPGELRSSPQPTLNRWLNSVRRVLPDLAEKNLTPSDNGDSPERLRGSDGMIEGNFSGQKFR